MGAALVISCFSCPRLLRDLLDLERLRVLRGVRVLGAGVDLELLELLTAEGVLRQHALDGQLDEALGLSFEQLTDGPLAQTARVTGVAVAELPELRRRNRDLLGV